MSTTSPQNLPQRLNGNEIDEAIKADSVPFVHLQVHSIYSPLESTARVAELVAKAKAFGMPALALTDQSNMCGAVDFYTQAKKAGIKAILGCEIFLRVPEVAKDARLGEDKLRAGRLVLLAQNIDGYRDLCRLISRGWQEGRVGDRPYIEPEWLAERAGNLLAIVGGIKSEIGWHVLRGRSEAAEASLRWLQQTFADRLYLGLQALSLKEAQTVNDWLKLKSRELQIPAVALGDVHYIEREDAASQEVLSCIRLGRTIQDSGRRVACDEFWFRDGASMAEIFADIPEAITNTLSVANRCDVSFQFTNAKGHQIYHLPTFQIPEGETVRSLDDYLMLEAERGLHWRFEQITFAKAKQESNWPELAESYRNRLRDEVAMIQKTGFSGYFLIVSDFIRWAKSQGIPVGPGRGSGAGSLVAWALRITDIDPIPYNLLFERFINPERISMPDFDVDFCQNRREEVIEYVKQKYGREKVCQIITFGKLQTKNCIRDIGRVLGMPYGEVDQIAKLVPERLGIKVQEALDLEPRLQELCETNPIIANLFRHARKLEGMIRNFGKHAGGVIITDRPMTEYAPLYADEDGSVMTQFNMEWAEKIGLVKFDFLGLKTLTHIQITSDLINSRPGADKDLRKFSIDDVIVDEKEPFDLISRGDTIGIFQVESSGMIDLCKRIRPVNLDELTAINALYRPGPLESGMVDDFIERKHGRTPIEYPVPQLEEVLRETFGVIVYQEQVMRAARVLAGYTLGEADLLRRAMGKKKVEEMAAQKERFVQGAAKLQISPEKSAGVFDLIEKFAGYGFNKSHATAYALISYQTAYLKYHYPPQFYAALLTMEMSDTDKLAKYIADAKDHKIPVLGPDVNESDRLFSVVIHEKKPAVRFGLEAIKNVGAAAVAAILEERNKNGPFRSFGDFCSRVPLRKVNRKTLETLVRTGAFDLLYVKSSVNRQSLFQSIDTMMSWGGKEFEHREIGQGALFAGLFTSADGPELSTAEPEIPVVKDWTYLEKLETERELLGFYVSGHPLDPYSQLIRSVATWPIAEVQRRAADGQFVVDPEERWKRGGRREPDPKLAGLITYAREIMTKKGARMAFATLEDLSGKIEVVCFPKTFETFGPLLKVGSVVVVHGNIEAQERVAKILASKIEPLESLAGTPLANAQVAFFRLDCEGTTKGQIQRLKEICEKHKGTCQGIIEYTFREEVKARFQLADNLKFQPNLAFMTEIREIFGKDVLALH